MSRRDARITGAAGVVIVAASATIAISGDLTQRIPTFLLLAAIAFVAYMVASVRLLRPGARGSRRLIVWLFVAGVAARAVLLPATPTLSTDIYRYLWEGRAVAQGYNPFALAPDAPELERYRDGLYDGVSHKHMETIYPPVAQAVFSLGARLSNGVTMQKLLFTLFDIATALALLMLLRARGRPAAAVVVYLWSPLVIIETAHSGHVDPVGVFFFVLGLWWLERERPASALVAGAISVLTKYLALVMTPFLLLRRNTAMWLPLAAGVVVLGFLPFAGAGEKLFASLRTYSEEWRFNGAAYELVSQVWNDPLAVRRVLALVAGVFILLQAVRQRDPVRYAFYAIGAVLLSAPTLYPWYIIWMVPLLCLVPNRAWILFTGLSMSSYWVWVVTARGGNWELPIAVYLIEYVPFLALLGWDAYRTRKPAVAPAP